MRFFYGEKNILRALEEAEFWKHQESEHTEVIQEIVPDLEAEYVDLLEEYKRIFDSTHGRIIQYIETVINSQIIVPPEFYQEILQILNIAIRQSQIFSDFLGKLISESEAVKNNPMAVTVINHIRRESEYFIGVVSAFLNYTYPQQNG
jgi:hypothetical protein